MNKKKNRMPSDAFNFDFNGESAFDSPRPSFSSRAKDERAKTSFLKAKEKRIALERKIRQRRSSDVRQGFNEAKVFVNQSVDGARKIGGFFKGAGKGSQRITDKLKRKSRGSLYD